MEFLLIMAKYPLQKIMNNKIIKYYLQKPDFLSIEDEKKLLEFIRSGNLYDFYDYGSKLIRNSRDVTNLYTYLINILESQDISNEELKNQVSWRLFYNSSIGWLNLHDSEILEYCKANTTDKELLEEIKEIKPVNWYRNYFEYVNIEKQISNRIENVEKNVRKYFEFIEKLLKDKKIKQEKYEEIIGYLQKETSIYKGEQIIGSLISKKLQEKIGFRVIVEKLNIKKSDSQILIGHPMKPNKII